MKKIINRMALCSLMAVVILSQLNKSESFAETAKIFLKPEDMKLGNIIKRNEIEKYYSEYKKIKKKVGENNIVIKLFKIKDENNGLFFDGCPYCFAEISSGKDVKYQSLGRYIVENAVTFLEKPENIISLRYEMGCNGSGCRGYYLFSLEKDTLLQRIGEIAVIGTDDKGESVFFNNNNIFETTNLFAHCCYPTIREYYKIEKTKLVKDPRTEESLSEIAKLDKNIAGYSKEIPKHEMDRGEELLGMIIKKYLYYRLVDKEQFGWQNLLKELFFYDKEYFWVRYNEKKEIEEIVKTLKDRIDSYDKDNKKQP